MEVNKKKRQQPTFDGKNPPPPQNIRPSPPPTPPTPPTKKTNT